NEIIRPLITSVLTNCAVFIPLIFLGGLAGAIFYDQALSIVIGVVSSLAVAILALPPLFVLLHRNKKGKPRKLLEIPVLVNVTTWYDRCLKWCFRFPMMVTIVVLVVAVSGVFLFNGIEKSRLPNITRYDFEVHIDWNEHINARESAQRAIEFA